MNTDDLKPLPIPSGTPNWVRAVIAAAGLPVTTINSADVDPDEAEQIAQQVRAQGGIVLYVVDEATNFPPPPDDWDAPLDCDDYEKVECREREPDHFPRVKNTKPRPAQCAPRMPRVVSYAASAEKPRPPPERGTLP